MAPSIQTVFRDHFEAYARKHGLPRYVHRAAYWIANCRSAALGGHLRRCPAGHVERAFYNSCHQRGCAQCQALASEKWLARQRARLLACAHHHLIFTLPQEFNTLWGWNRAPMARLLFATVRETLAELLEDPRHLGARAAFIAALHTWGRTLSVHPHLHVLVADGGLNDAGEWVKPRRSHFLPARVVMRLFRGKFLDRLGRELETGRLRRPEGLSPERARTMLNKLGRVKWHVYLRTRYAHGAGVLMYLARYLRGGPLKNAQLLQAGERAVSFRYSPHEREPGREARAEVMTLSPEAFLARYLAHLVPPGLQAVRGYGLYGAGARKQLDRARAAIGQPATEDPAPIDVGAFLARLPVHAESSVCPRCGARLVFSAAIARETGPPRSLH